MTQKEKLETLTGEKFPEPTPQETKKYNIPNSPFWHIENNEGHWLIMGKYRMNKTPFATTADLYTWLDKEQWNIMLSMAICAATDIINQKKLNDQDLEKVLDGYRDDSYTIKEVKQKINY